MTTIITKTEGSGDTASTEPATLTKGELAVNTQGGLLFHGNSSNATARFKATTLAGTNYSLFTVSGGNVVEIGAGTDGHVLTSTGTGTIPAWEAASGGGVSLGSTSSTAHRGDHGVSAYNSGATRYTHPSYDGDDIDIDTGHLSGAYVIDDLDLNVTTDSSGHVTDANATVATRQLTLANLGYTGATDANNYSHPSYDGDDISIDTGHLSGAYVIDDLDLNVTTDSTGHVTDANATVATRQITLSDLGYTGHAAATNNTGTVTSVAVTTAAGLDGATTITSSGTVALSLDLSELTDGTGDIDSNDEVIYLDNGTEKRKAFSELKLSEFNNDSSWTSNTGDIEGVTAGTGMSGGGTSGTVTLTNAGVTSIVAGSGISISGATGAVTVTASGGGGGVSLSGSTNNTVATVTGSDALVGEGTFTFDGSGAMALTDRDATITLGASHPSAAPHIKMYEGTSLKSGSSANITVATAWMYDAMSGAVMAIDSTEYDFAGGIYMGAV